MINSSHLNQVPKQSAKTRWEKFAAAKGIKKRKRTRLDFNETTGNYEANYGYQPKSLRGAAANAVSSDWLMEVPKNADSMVDMYQEKKDLKKSNIEKNVMQQRRNQEEAFSASQGKDYRAHKKSLLQQKISHPREDRVAKRAALEKQVIQAKLSTASMGKFEKSLENESIIKVKGDKRKVI